MTSQRPVVYTFRPLLARAPYCVSMPSLVPSLVLLGGLAGELVLRAGDAGQSKGDKTDKVTSDKRPNDYTDCTTDTHWIYHYIHSHTHNYKYTQNTHIHILIHRFIQSVDMTLKPDIHIHIQTNGRSGPLENLPSFLTY